MKKMLQLTWVVLMVGALVLGIGFPARAQEGAHKPIADTYIHRSYPTSNFGNAIGLTLAASNQGSCVEASYLLFKFSIPDTTITEASFYIQFATAGTGSEQMDLELLSSADTGWVEGDGTTGVTWNTQPALDMTTGVLDTSPSVDEGGLVEFNSPAFLSYLNDNPGYITLVVRADCPGVTTLPGGAIRGVYSRESTETGAYLTMNGPTAVEVMNLSASTQPSVSAPTLILVAALVALPTLAWLGSRAIRRRKS